MLRILALLICSLGALQAQSFTCTKNATATTTASGNLKIVTASSSSVRICAIYFSVQQGTTAANFSLIAGNGTNCSTNNEDVTPVWYGVAGAVQNYTQEIPQSAYIAAAATKDICIKLSAAPTNASVQVVYDLF